MKKLLFTVSIIILLLSCSLSPSEKQKEFAKIVEEQPIVVKAEWQTILSLWVQVEREALGLMPKEQAKYVAQNIAAGGLDYTQDDICVNVYVDPGNKLASACQSKD